MIEITQLTKRYGALTAVDDVSFNVAPGEVLGFLGPNGAGKSTTMKVITGFLAPTSGTVRVMGHDIETGFLQCGSGRSTRLSRPERRRQVDHDEGHHWFSGTDLRNRSGHGSRHRDRFPSMWLRAKYSAFSARTAPASRPR